jgi:uncharacterized protein
MSKTTIEIQGMHCNSCEILIEDELLQIPGVTSAKVSQRKGCADIYHDRQVSLSSIDQAVTNAGYSLGKDSKPLLSRNSDDYMQVMLIGLSLFALWTLSSTFGVMSSFSLPELNDYGSLPIVFLIGITAGISTCMALIGGLVLGVAARFSAKHPKATATEKFTPHLFFNLGRVLSFLFFGAIIGYAGSFFKLSPFILGTLMIIVSVVMFLLGAQLTELSPRLNGIKLTLPKQISRLLGMKERNEKEYSHSNAFLLGAMTFFLPCGFTQAMQLYAMSTGNPVAASLTMGVFALGTAPGLLGIGGLTSLVKGVFAKWFFKFAGVVVILLAVFNLQSGVNLSGIDKTVRNIFSKKVLSATTTSPLSGEEVILKATYSVANDMQPANFSVKAGSQVRLEVAAEDNGAGCMGSLALPGLSDKVEVFRKGVTSVFTFTAQNPGEYTIACAMGVPRGTIKVI